MDGIHSTASQVNAYDGVQIVDSLHMSKYHITTLAECEHCSCSGAPASQTVDNGDPKNLPQQKHAMPSNLLGTTKMLGDGHTVTIINVQSKSSSPHIYSQNLGFEERPPTPREDSKESNCYHACKGHIYKPILPWINGDGRINSTVYEGLSRRVIGYVMQYPGIMEVCFYYLRLLIFQWETDFLLFHKYHCKIFVTLYDILDHNIF